MVPYCTYRFSKNGNFKAFQEKVEFGENQLEVDPLPLTFKDQFSRGVNFKAFQEKVEFGENQLEVDP